MRTIVSLVLFLVAFTGPARAQLDCSAPDSCTAIKYGLGTDTSYRQGEWPQDPERFDHGDFGADIGGISYVFVRADPLDPLRCSNEDRFRPLPGQIILRELTACTPTSEGPKCTGGANAGKSCHLNANAQFASVECPESSCAQTAGTGCRVEIPISDGGKTPPVDTSEYWVSVLNNRPGVFDLGSLTGNGPGASSGAKECTAGPTLRKACSVDGDCGAGGKCEACFPTNIRQKPSMATRYRLPEYRRTGLGLPEGATYLRWDKGVPRGVPGSDPALDPRIAGSTAFRIQQDDAAVCCNSPNPGLCTSSIFPFAKYPLIWRSTCVTSTGIERFVNEDNIVPDWIFEAGMNSRWFTDSDYELPGVLHGVCLENRETGCTRGGSECEALGDVCDFREPGIRIQIQAVQIRDSNGDPVQTACGSGLIVLRGAPGAGCTLTPRYPLDGDPGADCGVFNYGVDQRSDLDCDGAADYAGDKCPFLSEWDQSEDTDGDCALPGGVDADCRGDECECGDATLEGRVNVEDIVEINLMIFGAKPRQRTADANNDLLVNVSDIVAMNQEIYVPDSSSCRQITSLRCGNNVRDAGEACDNGAKCTGGATPGVACDASGLNTCGTGVCERLGGDGCNASCRVERGWTCTGDIGQSSVCTPG